MAHVRDDVQYNERSKMAFHEAQMQSYIPHVGNPELTPLASR